MIGFFYSPTIAQNSNKMKDANKKDMSEIQILKRRNEIYAQNHQKGLTISPKFSTIILTCIDARVDPAHFLGLELGEALVLRNPAGRVTPEVERDLAILCDLRRPGGRLPRGLADSDAGSRHGDPLPELAAARRQALSRRRPAHIGRLQHERLSAAERRTDETT